MTVLGLDEIGKSDNDLAGGKGANLGELISLGFPVPPGFVVCADEYAAFIRQLDIPGNDKIPVDRINYCENLRQQILDLPTDVTLNHLISEQHNTILAKRDLPEVVYAVRSSATREDTADASFAGQHDTYYYVSAADIPMMLRKCWASLWSDTAFSYRQSQGIEHRSVNMAVVVQEMVPSDVSGVTFTADPVSGSDRVIITESSWGMGAAIVDGRVSPDQYVVDKTSGRLTAIKVSDKKFMVPASLSRDEISRLQEVPADLRRAETLSNEQVDAITHWALRAEVHFGCPQDIEWAIANNTLFLLQSRPITIMGSAEDEPPAGKYILFKPVAENFTDPLMPLTQDILGGIIPFMKIINGRIYANLEHIRMLIPLKQSDADLARMAYLSEPLDKKPKVSIPRLLVLVFIACFNYLIMGVFYRRTANLPDDFMLSFRTFFREVVNDPGIQAPDAIVHLFTRFRFFEPAGNMVLLVNLVAPRYMLLINILSKLITRWAPTMPPDTASLLCSGTTGVLSTDMGRGILGLARTARIDDFIRGTISSMAASEANKALRADRRGDSFIHELDQFLAMHGHRALKEFEINSVRWEEDPSLVLGMVRNYLLVDTDGSDNEERVRETRMSLWQDLENNFGQLPFESLGQPRLKLTRMLVERTKYYMKLRENSRFYHIMGFYAVRLKVLQLEEKLLLKGALKCKDDIFYLNWAEACHLQSGELGWQDIEDTIRTRRMEHIRLTKLVPPKTYGINMGPVTTSDDARSMSGQGASPGIYEGIARVIMDPAVDSEIEPGEILIAPYTDPAWTPLFLTARAAVIEIGSYLSHAGTIAREYGMPCVVDVANCTNRIQTGDRIIVDGSNGKVTLLGKGAAVPDTQAVQV